MNIRGTGRKWSCEVFQGKISEWYRKRGWKSCVAHGLGPVSIELGAIR